MEGGREVEVNFEGKMGRSFSSARPAIVAGNTQRRGGGERCGGGGAPLPPHHLLFMDVFAQ